jgi:hypothetical protein
VVHYSAGYISDPFSAWDSLWIVQFNVRRWVQWRYLPARADRKNSVLLNIKLETRIWTFAWLESSYVCRTSNQMGTAASGWAVTPGNATLTTSRTVLLVTILTCLVIFWLKHFSFLYLRSGQPKIRTYVTMFCTSRVFSSLYIPSGKVTLLCFPRHVFAPVKYTWPYQFFAHSTYPRACHVTKFHNISAPFHLLFHSFLLYSC